MQENTFYITIIIIIIIIILLTMIIVQHKLNVVRYIIWHRKSYICYIKFVLLLVIKLILIMIVLINVLKIIFLIVNATLYHFYRDTIIISSGLYEDIYGIITLLSDIFFHHRATINSVKSLNLWLLFDLPIK